MVKGSERKKDYHPRGPHKEGCLCAICKAKREAVIPTPQSFITRVERQLPPPIPEVRLDSLAVKSRFQLRGEENLVKEKIEGMVVCYNLALRDTTTLGGATMVEPIK